MLVADKLIDVSQSFSFPLFRLPAVLTMTLPSGLASCVPYLTKQLSQSLVGSHVHNHVHNQPLIGSRLLELGQALSSVTPMPATSS